MIDTIHAELKVKEIGSLFKYKISGTPSHGYLYENYLVKNISISTKKLENGYRLKITGGSLNKFLYGTNLGRFTKLDVEQSINDLSKLIEIDLTEAIIKRIDIGANIYMEKPVSSYLPLLVNKPLFKHTTFNDLETVIFYTEKTSLTFYDKVKEFNSSRTPRQARKVLSSFLDNKNILRYELQLKKRLDVHKIKEELKLKDLFDKRIYIKLIKLWYDNYRSIEKDNFNIVSCYIPFEEYLKIRGIKSIGLSKTIIQLKSWTERNNKSRDVKSKLKKKILKLNNEYKPIDLIKELNRKIKFEKEFYL